MNPVGTENDEAIARALGQEDEIVRPQMETDADLAFLLQIEEIIKSENVNHKNKDDQLEKTHSALTNALQTTEETSFMGRMIALLTEIKTRYADCVTKNQELINQIRELAVKTLPLLLPLLNTRDRTTKASGALVVVGLAANYLNGRINFDEVQQILQRFIELKNDSNSWWEFFEQVTYILLAVTVPMLTQTAMGRVMQTVNASV